MLNASKSDSLRTSLSKKARAQFASFDECRSEPSAEEAGHPVVLARVHRRKYIYIYVYIYISMRMYLCIYIYVYLLVVATYTFKTCVMFRPCLTR